VDGVDAEATTQSEQSDGIDLRLVPAALTCWAVTAIGIVWRAGVAAAVVCVLVAVAAWVVGGRARAHTGVDSRRAVVSAIVLGAALVGAGFAWAVAVRVHSLDHHPLAAMYGRSVDVTVTASEQPR
jgi:competence protein ComEC